MQTPQGFRHDVLAAAHAAATDPLTDDAGNVALFLDALTPDVMPVDGQRTDRAIAWSVRLLKQADALIGGAGLAWRDHCRAAKKRARKIQFTRGRPNRFQLSRELIAIANATRPD